MPTQRFFNLKEEKRCSIVKAAVHEFCRVPYSAASINQIIKEADISRGSFYTYFEDKDDLLQYLVSGFREKCREQVYDQLERHGGDLFETVCAMLEQVMDAGTGGRGAELYRNALTELNPVTQSRMFGVKGFLHEDDVYRRFIHDLYEQIDAGSCPIGSEEKLACLVEIMMVLVIKAIFMYYMGAADRERILEVTRKQMYILKNGALSGDVPEKYPAGHVDGKEGDQL
ncbi:MAG: TetR/AcrR family transcriptional regulator [Clostridium sp.]|nr:TetR/AcrR family transcriptional regulator [Clostridium sp.]